LLPFRSHHSQVGTLRLTVEDKPLAIWAIHVPAHPWATAPD
jgi:hypothetical protein